MTDKPRDDALPPRRVVLCADDFAQTRGTVEGILALIDAERLSAVSCLVESPLWADAAVRLRSRPSTFDIGLHFNLTHDFAGNGHRPGALPLTILAAYLCMIRRATVERILHRQLDLFEEVMGRPPDFVDGHHHVHQLPVIRDALVSVLRTRYPSARPAVRVAVPSKFHGLKESLIAGLGGRKLLETVRREGIPHNTDFAGTYDFSRAPAFAKRFSQWLAEVHDGGLIMCHPAHAAQPNGDPIAAAREWEYSHLASGVFLSALRQWRVRLARFRDLPVLRDGA